MITITPAKLRPDVERAVDVMIFRAAGLWRHEKYMAYADAKRQLSQLCGWDAPLVRRDDEQYTLAVSRFVKGVGL